MIETPFDIRYHHVVIKGDNRMRPTLGPELAATAEAEAARVLTDRSGLENVDSDWLNEHGVDEETMWAADTEQGEPGIVFDMHGEQTAGSIAVWNYNKPAYTDQGIAKMDVSVWTEEDGWRTVLKDVKLQEAEGTADYDIPTIITFKPVAAEKIRFEKMTAFSDKDHRIGLSEVRFYQPLGPAACNPQPQDSSQCAYSEATRLLWTAGQDAVVHDIYVGEDEASLQFLGRVKGLPEVTVSGLSAGRGYVWRVDEVTEDGTVSTGPLWSFITKGSCVGYWPLDEGLEDLVGGRNGVVSGEPTWVAGHRGKALEFDGTKDLVEIPPLNFNTHRMTICAWIQATEQVVQIPGIIFCRSDNTVAGIHLLGDRLRYHWNNSEKTWGWDSGLRVPMDGSWVFVALTVQPGEGVLYLYRDGQMQSSANAIPHQAEEFDGPLYLARDLFGRRYFKGVIDDVRIYDFALSPSQVEQVCQEQGIGLIATNPLHLVNADLVEAGQSLKEVAAEQEAVADTEKGKNLIPVLVIVAVIAVIAIVSMLRKKK